MAITTAITDLIKSVAELISSVFGAAYSIVHSFLTGVFGLFAGFFAMIGDLGEGVFDIVGGVGKFIAGKSHTMSGGLSGADVVIANIVVLGLVGAAGYAYMRFVQQPQQQGRKPMVNGVGAKKVN